MFSRRFVQNQSYNFTPWSHPWPPTAPPPCSWPPESGVPENCLNCCPIPVDTIGFDTKITSLARSEPKLQFHSMRSSWVSFCPPPCSWPSDRSENGIKRFPMPQNIRFDNKIISLAWLEPIEKVPKSKYLSLIVQFSGLPLKLRLACATSKTYVIGIIFGYVAQFSIVTQENTPYGMIQWWLSICLTLV